MNKFHPNERNNEVPLDGKPDAVIMKRSSIKLSEGPRIMVCMPIGGKQVTSVLECPQCKDDHGNSVKYTVDEGFRPQALVPVDFMFQHMNWLPPLNVTMGYTYKTGMLSAAARQIMTQECLRMPTVKYLFFVDDDMIIPQMGLYTLYNTLERNPDMGLVSGVYTTRQNPPEPLIYTDHGEGAAWEFPMGPGAGVTDIMGAGAGCMLVRTEAIRDWQAENPDTAIWCDSSEFPAANGGRVTWGHDVRFTRNLKEAGWRTCVEGSVLCGHYDIASRNVFSVPADAPGFKNRAKNTDLYWDAVYAREGIDSWRKYEEMFGKVERHLYECGSKSVIELGCGPGILGQRLTAKLGVKWWGCDISDVAVSQAKARYLNAEKADVRGLEAKIVKGWHRHCDCVVATEMLEHLKWEDGKELLEKLNASGVETLVFATPYQTMHPNDVPEHEVFVDDEYVEGVKAVLSNYKLEDFNVVDAQGHAVWLFIQSKPVKKATKKKATKKKVAKKKV